MEKKTKQPFNLGEDVCYNKQKRPFKIKDIVLLTMSKLQNKDIELPKLHKHKVGIYHSLVSY